MRGNYLRQFFGDLELKVAQWAGVVLEGRRLGTIDERVQQGEDWDDNLSRGLGEDKAFAAILTPLYFNRPNCGKELGVFLLRHPHLGINQTGALTGVTNVIPIRWMPEDAYTQNGVKDSLIPPILRLINDTPADDGRMPERTRAIQRYRRSGVWGLVSPGSKQYEALLDLFAMRIRDMRPLPPAADVSFETAVDAFEYDWSAHFASAGTQVAPPPAPPPPVSPSVPRALSSIVAFYITHRPFTPDPSAVAFADQLVAEALPHAPAPADPVFNALLADVRAAGVAEALTVFHCAADPAVPASPDRLLAQLTALSQSHMLTALVVDPVVWPGPAAGVVGAQVEQIIRSPEWNGLVLVPSLDMGSADIERLVDPRGLAERVVVLPQDSAERIAALRRAFVDARGRVLRTSSSRAPDAEPLPLPKSVGAERG